MTNKQNEIIKIVIEEMSHQQEEHPDNDVGSFNVDVHLNNNKAFDKLFNTELIDEVLNRNICQCVIIDDNKKLASFVKLPEAN